MGSCGQRTPVGRELQVLVVGIMVGVHRNGKHRGLARCGAQATLTNTLFWNNLGHVLAPWYQSSLDFCVS